MKSYVLLLLICIASFVVAQTPQKPEDISPLLIGEKMPDTALKTIEGHSVNVSEIFSKKKTVLIFYRGSWCPYCSMHLAEMSKIEDDLLSLGYQIIAISPDAPENLKKSIEKNQLKYTLLSDQHGKLIRAAGLAFKAPTHYEKLLVENQGSDAELILPVPSLFILDEQGKILFEYINPDFKTRINGSLVLAAAKVFSEQK